MIRWINKQPWIQPFWNLWCHYQDKYDWISPVNELKLLCFILNSLWGKISMVNLITCIFSLFEALNDVFEVQCFQGFIFYNNHRHWVIAGRAMQLRCLNMETLLHNSFNRAMRAYNLQSRKKKKVLTIEDVGSVHTVLSSQFPAGSPKVIKESLVDRVSGSVASSLSPYHRWLTS